MIVWASASSSSSISSSFCASKTGLEEISLLEVSPESIVIHKLGVSWKSHRAAMARRAVIERHTRQSGGERAKKIPR